VPVFVRRSEPPTPRKDYTVYRPEVREDFTECCAYCLFPELLAGGKENFELDHFHPKAREDEFAGDVNDFYNLYYSCHVCNNQKRAHWPTADVLASGCRFIDLCSEDFSAHFVAQQDGEWKPLTNAADWASERLLLNRGHLKQIRRLLQRIAAEKELPPIDWNRPTRDHVAIIFPDGFPT
jgi:hypothetical protein